MVDCATGEYQVSVKDGGEGERLDEWMVRKLCREAFSDEIILNCPVPGYFIIRLLLLLCPVIAPHGNRVSASQSHGDYLCPFGFP